MQRSKKIFLVVALVFLAIVGAIVFDFSRRTTFPGGPRPQESPGPQKDTLDADPRPVSGDSASSVRR